MRLSLKRYLRLKSQADQIGRSIASGSPPLQQFFKMSCFAHEQQTKLGSRNLVTRYGSILNTAITMKDLI